MTAAAAAGVRPDGSGVEVRYQAALTVARVVADGLTLDRALAERRVADADQALLAELCYGTLRWQPALHFLLERLLTRPLAAHEHQLRALLWVGLYQLRHLRLPHYAAVAASVGAARRLRKPWAVGLSNAVLRGFLRRRDELDDALAASAAADAHPGWLRRRLRRDWPQHWQAMLAANNQRPPLTLRVNLARGSRDDALRALAAAGIGARADGHGAAAVTVDAALPVDRLPGFQQGLISVQDAAAQLAAPLLDPQPGERLLDACAAPGGKTGHLLERAAGLSLTALDLDPSRLERVADNLRRLRLQQRARLIAGDAADPASWWDGRPFDAILLDAPCTGSGVIRRHPDIKLLRRSADIDRAAQRQRRLLDALWPLLKPGGRLLYATCSVFKAENSDLVEDFLRDRRDDAAPLPIVTDRGLPQPAGRQLLTLEPSADDAARPTDRGAAADGFFYALLGKRVDPA